MRRRSSRAARFLAALLGAALVAAATAQGRVHRHGHATLEVVLQGPELAISLALPLDVVVGFERPPRNDAERAAAATALARLRDGASLWRTSGAAQCRLASAVVGAPVAEGRGAATGGHVDADVAYVFRCGRPEALEGVETALFEAFPRLERLDVQASLPHGQRRLVLRRGAPVLRLAR